MSSNQEPKNTRQATFKLTGSEVEYKLPDPRDLRPSVDSKTGSLDIWPAHSAKPPALPPNNTVQDHKGPPKPKFLDKLEKFLVKELRALECTDPNQPNEKRLQAFREVFEYLIDDFKTYRPLLSSIKNEYEKVLDHQQEKIRELEPLQSLIITISERCDKKLLSAKQEEKEEITSLKTENDKLKKTILKMRGEHGALQEQVKTLQDEIALEYRKYRDECDARKLLIQDLNDLKYQQDEAKRAALGKQDEDGAEDVTMLKLALKKTREDLATKTQKLAEVMADFGDVVPRRNFEELDAQFKVLQSELEETKGNHKTLMSEHSLLIGVHKKLMEHRDELASECEQLRRSATPRPDWDRCAKYVEGGNDRWTEISKDKSSNDLVDVLLSEMTGQDIAIIQAGAGTGNEYFEAMGTESSVPRYLRCEGQIVNRRLGKKDAVTLVKDIWKERAKYTAERKPSEQENFAEFVFEFLRTKFGTDALAYEWGYNVHDACSRYNHDAKIGQFFGILTGEFDEKLYHDQVSTIERLHRSLSQEADSSGLIKPDGFSHVLELCFPWKEETSVKALIKAAETELGSTPSDALNYKQLFEQDEEGCAGLFLKKLEEQTKAERHAYVSELSDQLGQATSFNVDEVRQAFIAIDPLITEEVTQTYLQRAFGVTTDKLKANIRVDKNILIKNLQTGSVQRVGEGNA
eukprot:gene18901-20803_t